MAVRAATYRAKDSPTSSSDRESFLTFDVSGANGPVASATVRLWGVVADSASPADVALHAVADTTWSENTLTWNNRPTAGASLDTTTIDVHYAPSGAWFEWDATSYVNQQLAAGKTRVSFALRSPTQANIRVDFNSDEAATDRPQLVLAQAQTPQPPAAPSNLAATTVSHSQINLTWSDNASNETGFHIQRSADGGNTWTLAMILTDPDVTAWSDAGRSPNTSYLYRVLAYNAHGDSAWSATATVTTPFDPTNTPPAAPTNLTAGVVSASQIDLNWVDRGGDETQFVVERSSDGGTTWTPVGTTPADDTSYSVTGLSPATEYHFRVRATNGGGASAWSGTSWGTTRAEAAPAAPAGLAGAAWKNADGSASVRWTWNDRSDDEDGFTVEVATNSTFAGATAHPTAAGAAFLTLDGLAANTVYYARVAARNASGASAWSPAAQVSTTNASTTFLRAEAVSDTQIDLLFSAPAAGAELIIERQHFDTNALDPTEPVTEYRQVAVVPAGRTSYSDTGLTEGTRYRYRVREAGSAAPPWTPTAATLPAAPTGVAVTEAAKSGMGHDGTSINFQMNYNVTWQDNSDHESGYILDYDGDDFEGIWDSVYVPANATGATVNWSGWGHDGTAVSPPARFRVRAVSTAGGTTQYAKSSTVSVNEPSPPDGWATLPHVALDATAQNFDGREGAGATKNFFVVRSYALTPTGYDKSALDVQFWASASGGAGAPDATAPDTVNVPANSNYGPGTITVQDDDEPEPAEAAFVVLKGGDGYIVGNTHVAAYVSAPIKDDDWADLDVDSNNNDGTGLPSRAIEDEDAIEDDESLPGKVLAVNGAQALVSLKFAPGINFDPTKGPAATVKFVFDDRLRLWQGGAAITSDQPVTLNGLGFKVQAADGSQETGDLRLEVQVDRDGDGEFELSDAVRMTSIQPQIGVDRSRDGDLDLHGQDDRTSAQQPYKFWLNSDHEGFTIDDDDTDGAADSSSPGIAGTRDLEDFARMHIALPVTADPAGNDWEVRLAFANVSSGAPAVNLYYSAANDETYLTDESVALDQVGRSTDSSAFIAVTTGQETVIPSSAFNDPDLLDPGYIPFIFEGVSAGVGALEVRYFESGTLVASEAVHLDLRDITEFYEHYSVGDTTDGWPAAQPSRVGTFAYQEESPEEDVYTLFVHGWRLTTTERRRFAETAYKRLWWEDYRGRFGLFSWPTEHTEDPVFDPGNFNRSERKAFMSATGLNQLLRDLNGQYPGNVHLFAHSMGNVVVSEALRVEQQTGVPQQLVKTYIASQSAVAAHAYDATAPERFPGPLASWETPEVYASYPPTGQPYFAEIGAAAGEIINFYNPEDYALINWEINQNLKPASMYTYDEVTNTFSVAGRILTFPNDRYEIYAFAAEARSWAAGAQGDIGGPFTTHKEINLDVNFGFGGEDKGHSAQFLSTIHKRAPYWRQLLIAFGLTTTGNP